MMPHPAAPNSVLVLHAGALGDCVLTLHLARAMKRLPSHPTVTMAARSPIARWAARHGLIDDATSLDAIGAHRWYGPRDEAEVESVRYLRSFDAVVSFLGGPDEPISQHLAAMTEGRLLAIDPQPGSGGNRGDTSTATQVRTSRHIVQQWADRAAKYGWDVVVDEAAGIDFDDSAQRAFADALTSRLGVDSRPLTLGHPGSGGLEKCCPLEAMECLVGMLRSRGRSVAWMIGPDEWERFGADYRRRLEGSAPVLFVETVEEAADAVAGAEAFIGVDAGMTHVAALAGVRTVAIFGPTDPAVWRPLGPDVRLAAFPSLGVPIAAWAHNAVTRLGIL
jgi:ADP-heptose:LPS heptosyltransferase